MTNNIEKVTLDTTATLTSFLMALDAADIAEVARFNNTESAIQLLKPLRAQYATLQDGRSKGKKPAAGELPAVIYFEVIESVYNKKKAIADDQNVEFNLNYKSYRDYQVEQLKFYIQTGELFNSKKSTLQERAMVAMAKLEKKLKAEQAKLDKAVEDAEKAKAKAGEVINTSKAKIKEAADIKADLIVAAPTPAVKELLDYADTVIETAKKDAVKADNIAADALDDANDALVKVVKTTAQLNKAKDKLEKLSAPKAEPKPDLSNVEFSKDCRAEMLDVLETLSKDYSDVELLCLASLIRKRCTPSKA